MAPGVYAQPLSPQRSAAPRFESASVKLCGAGDASTYPRIDSGVRGPSAGLLLTCEPLELLIQRAYLMYRDGRSHPEPIFLTPIAGLPAWGRSDRYTIEATAPGPQSLEMIMGPMLQSLLEERFRLKIRSETGDVPAYGLTVADGGPKFQATVEGSCTPVDFSKPAIPRPTPQHPFCDFITLDPKSAGMIAYGMTMARLSLRLSGALGQPVIDRTGLAGAFDIPLDVSPGQILPGGQILEVHGGSAPVPSNPGGALPLALQKVGLRLEPSHGPAESVIVDRVERPSGN